MSLDTGQIDDWNDACWHQQQEEHHRMMSDMLQSDVDYVTWLQTLGESHGARAD